MKSVDNFESASSGPDGERSRPSARCPNCGTEYPRPAGGSAPAGGDAAGACPHCGYIQKGGDRSPSAVAYEDKTALCLPYELERVARAEAVDGWQLLETTVSEAVPGMIEAHFRRPVRVTHSPPERTSTQKPKSAQARRTRASASPSHGPPVRKRGPARHTAGLDQLVFLLLLFLGVMWAADNLGLVGFLLALWLLPQFLRRLLGMRRRSRRSREKKNKSGACC